VSLATARPTLPARLGVALLGAAVAAGTLVAGSPAALAVAPTAEPVITAPAAGATVPRNPVLAWEPTAGAAKYRVQVSASSTFSPLLYTVDTVNLQATPVTDLPLGTIHWRVAATDGSTGIGPFAVSTFVKEFGDAPVLEGPAHDSDLVYPTDAPTLSWQPLAGATTYRVEVDDAEDFVGATTQLTPNTAFTPTVPQSVGQRYYWRVRGESTTASVVSSWSETRSYRFLWPTAPALVRPPVPTVGQPLPVVQDVVLEWTPVAGAASYELQVSGNGDWTNNMTAGFPVTVFSARYSPATTLPDGSYFWRVRAKDTATPANAGPWSVEGQFRRAWNEPVTLLSPPHGAAAVEVPTLRWSPVQPGVVDDPTTRDPEHLSTHATHYVVEVSQDMNFSPNTVSSCVTYRTEWTPYTTRFPVGYTPTNPVTCTIDLVDGTTYWWRVRGYDGPRNVAGGLSEARSFTYRKGQVQLLSPAPGAVVDTPTLSWTPVADAAQYEVTVSAGTSTKTYRTHSTSLTPTASLGTSLPLSVTWTVRPVDSEGNGGVAPGARSFTLAEAADNSIITITSPAEGAASPRMPLMAWTPVTNATKYRVYYSVGTTEIYTPFSDLGSLPYASFTHLGSVLAPGDYRFYVEAFNKDNVLLDRSGSSGFTVTGYAPESAPLTAPANCALVDCQPLTDTPTFRWQSVPDAGLYVVYLANDPNFNNIVREYVTEHPTVTPRESLPDNSAGQSYYWYVRPCRTLSHCGPFAPPYTGAFAFRKQSKAIEVVSPAYDAVVTGPPTFVWTDFLATNQALAPFATQSAKTYRLQVSKVPDFVTLIDDVTVDQTTYTPHAKVYPEGPLYWRVQALDASGNALTFSQAPAGSETQYYRLLKDQPEVTQHVVAPGEVTLRWDAQPFATRYDVEIYANGDTLWSPGNKLGVGFSGQTRVAAWTPSKSMPAGSYAWRARRVDQGSVVDDWSTGGTFTVGLPSPTLLTPADGSAVAVPYALLDWEPVTGAASYRVEVSLSSAFATTLENVVTAMTEYATTKTFPAGQVFWRVTALNPDGKPLGPAASRVLNKVVEGAFFGVNPARVLDTRSGNGAPVGPVAGGDTIDVQVTGLAGVPTDHVTSVVLNVTLTAPTTSGYLTVFPSGTERPSSSNLNFVRGQTVPNLVMTRVSSEGKVAVFNSSGATHVIADVLGYYTDGVPAGGSQYHPLAPARLLDTRKTSAVGGNTARRLKVTGVGGVPSSGVGAVIVNVTVTAPTAAGFLTVHPTGTARPISSNLNFVRGLTVANLVVAKVGTGGNIELYNSAGATHVVVDVAGWFTDGASTTGSRFTGLNPARLLDTRSTATPLGPGNTRALKVTGVGGVPATGVVAVVVNVTAVAPTTAGYLTVYPGGTRPSASNLNFTAGKNVPNLVVAKVSNGSITIFNSSGKTHVVVDVVGWFS
jgi:hypothetical protein